MPTYVVSLWWISKKIRHAIGMDDPNDAVNSQNRCRFLAEKAKKQHWDDNNFCEKLTSKKHGKDSGHVGNNFKRVGKFIFRTYSRSKKRCMKAVMELRVEIRENLKKESIKIPELNLKANKEDELRQTTEANAPPTSEEIPDEWPEARCAECCPSGGKKGSKVWKKAPDSAETFFCRSGQPAVSLKVRLSTLHKRAKKADCAKFCRYVNVNTLR